MDEQADSKATDTVSAAQRNRLFPAEALSVRRPFFRCALKNPMFKTPPIHLRVPAIDAIQPASLTIPPDAKPSSARSVQPTQSAKSA
ncbi:MAG: hypothetical protein WBA82_03860, partial [Castellaniella sp.]|uniref:hypothetical protein n=1 Tax=Castellaniella sp. TaxID=1955812 RepID=UPI003C72F8CD